VAVQLRSRTLGAIGAVSLYRLVGSLGELMLDPVAGATTGTVLRLFSISAVSWALFAIALYVSIADVDQLIPINTGQRVIITGSATAYAVTWHAMYFRFLGPIPPPIETSALRMVGVTVGTVVVLVPTTTGGDWKRVGTLTIGCFSVGLVGGFVAGISPLPEVGILLGLTWLASSRPLPASLRPLVTPATLDVETRLTHGILKASSTSKGRYALCTILTGFVLSGLFFIVVFGMAYARLIGAQRVASWVGFLGVGLVLTAYAGYGVWFWLRTLHRLPTFIAQWTGQSTTHPSVVRPVGLFVPGSVFISGFLLIAMPGRLPIGSVSPSLLGIVLLLLGTVLIWKSITMTADRDPQPSKSDQYAVPGALVVQAIPVAVFLFLDVVASVLALLVLFVLPDLKEQFGAPPAHALTCATIVVCAVLLWPFSLAGVLSIHLLPAGIGLAIAVGDALSERYVSEGPS